MHIGVGFGIDYIVSFTATCYQNPFVIIILFGLLRPCAPLIVSQLITLACILTYLG